MNIQTCFTCKMQFGMPESFYETARQFREKMTFYCPAGHQLHFTTGESESDKMRRERDRAIQEQARLQEEINRRDQRIEDEKRRTAAARGQVTKIKNRVGNGVCPCCSRTFSNLHNHMANKHPTYKNDAA